MEILWTSTQDSLKIVALSDTHIYRAKDAAELPFLPAIAAQHPDLILHGGDICDLSVLKQLRQIAPVYAVRGNRDLFNWFSLPAAVDIRWKERKIRLVHGEGNLFHYLKIKLYTIFCRIRHEEAEASRLNALEKDCYGYDIYLFGHSHRRYCLRRGKTILVNLGHLNIGKLDLEPEIPSFWVLQLDLRKVSCTNFLWNQGTFQSGDEKNFLIE